MSHWNRRQWLCATGAAAATVLVSARSAQAAAVVRETNVISYQPDLFHGWPTLARCRSGRLLLSYSGGRESHVCPFGRVELMQSDDGGQSWTWPRVLLDTAIDDRDSGVLETARGTLLVTTFTSLAYESILAKAENNPTPEKNPWPLPPERMELWRARLIAVSRPSSARRNWACGCFARRTAASRGRRPTAVWSTVLTDPSSWPTAGCCTPARRSGNFRSSKLPVGRESASRPTMVSPGDGSPTCPCGLATSPLNTTNCMPWRPRMANSYSTSATTIRPMLRKRCRANRPMGARPGACRTRSACGDFPPTYCDSRNGHLLMTYGHRRPPFGNQAA